jgi:phosphatidylserine decarboxylase
MLGSMNQEPDDPTDTHIKGLLQKVKSRGNVRYYIVIYLAPRKYHRFHSSGFHTGLTRRHIPGYMYLVRPSYVETHTETFK